MPPLPHQHLLSPDLLILPCERSCRGVSLGQIPGLFFSREARVLHSFRLSLGHVFIKIFMVGPQCAGSRRRREGAGLKQSSRDHTRSFALMQSFPLPACSWWAPHQCLIRAGGLPELTNRGDDSVGNGIPRAGPKPGLEAEPLGLP